MISEDNKISSREQLKCRASLLEELLQKYYVFDQCDFSSQ